MISSDSMRSSTAALEFGSLTNRLCLCLIAVFLRVFAAAPLSANCNSVAYRTVEEYRPYLPPRVFSRFVAIQNDPNILLIDKLKQLDKLYESLPVATLRRLPLPRAFRRLPVEERDKARRIYFAKRLPFEEKLARLDALVQRQARRARPSSVSSAVIERDAADSDDLPIYVHFDVPVLLRFDGKIEMLHLQRYLAADEFDLLLRILRQSENDTMRSRLVGRLLKEAYSRHGAYYFPIPLLGATDDSVGREGANGASEKLQRMAVQLMFKRNDFDAVDPVAKRMSALKASRLADSDLDEDFEPDFPQLPR